MMEIGTVTNNMEKGHLHGKMAENIQETMFLIKNRVLELLNGQMGVHITDIGKMVLSMA